MRFLVGVVLLAACSDAPTPEAIPHVTGPMDVVLRLGSYDIAMNIDEFVVGPEVVVYGDGTVHARLYDGPVDGQATFSRLTGMLDEDELQELLRAAVTLPSTSPIGEPATDGTPLMLVVGDASWAINDLGAQPWKDYVDLDRLAPRT